MSRKLKSLFVAAALTFSSFTTMTASATEPTCYKTVVRYETITVYEIRKVPYIDYITTVDAYGCAHQEKVTRYRTVKVPVEKVIKIVQKVPVY